jgi:catechol 2,3-dioxygenase-like lactoylglutathione lyase family enzyme
MVMGAHVLLYSQKPEEDRTFFRDVLGFRCVDAGGGWLIFGLPPAELAVHPKDTETGQVHAGHAMIAAVLYLMCDDLQATVKMLEAKKVRCTEISRERWGIITTVRMPSGAEIGLYQPTHPTALGLAQKKNGKRRPGSARRSKKQQR